MSPIGSKTAKSRRRTVAMIGAVVAVVLALVGGLAVLFASHHRPSDTALDPLGPTSEPTSDIPGGTDLSGGLASGLIPDGFAADAGNQALGASGASFGAAGSAMQLPAAPPLPQLPPPPQLPPLPNLGDWSAMLQPVLDSQANATAANIGGAITGAVGGVGAATVNSAAVLLGDLIRYNAYANNGPTPAAALEAAGAGLSQLSQLPPPDFSGLSSAFAAAAAAPPVLGLMPAELPPPPQLPLPPTPEQVAAMAALPFLLPALPPPPPVGLPPPPPIPLPSITRLLGLPF